jgi:hypothetical protein
VRRAGYSDDDSAELGQPRGVRRVWDICCALSKASAVGDGCHILESSTFGEETLECSSNALGVSGGGVGLSRNGKHAQGEGEERPDKSCATSHDVRMIVVP